MFPIITKKNCLKGLDFIAQTSHNDAVAITAENYYTTVENMSEEDFQKVVGFYETFINKYEPKFQD